MPRSASSGSRSSTSTTSTSCSRATTIPTPGPAFRPPPTERFEHQPRPTLRGGTVYVNSVAGPKQYSLDRKPEQKRTAEGTQLYQVVSIDGDTLRLEARTALGELYDAFTLKKRPGQANELIEQGPGTPERHPEIPAEKPKAKAAAAPAAAARR